MFQQNAVQWHDDPKTAQTTSRLQLEGRFPFFPGLHLTQHTPAGVAHQLSTKGLQLGAKAKTSRLLQDLQAKSTTVSKK